MTDDTLAKHRYEQVLELAARAHAEIPPDSLLSPSTRGGTKVHPAVGAWLRLERAAIEFGQRLGLEQDQSRRAPGGQLGVARAPDRKTPPRITRIK